MNNDDILTGDILKQLGFKDIGDFDIGSKPIYRITPPKHLEFGYYPYEIQIVLANYPETSPNCGIVSIHSPKCEASSVPRDLISKENWTKEDEERAANYKIQVNEFTQGIAWHVSRVGRLKMIYHSLTNMILQEVMQNI